VQWLIDPGNAPTERDIAAGLLRLAGHLTDRPVTEQTSASGELSPGCGP
jgi:hypothetical protein